MEIWTGVACLVADPKCEEFRPFGDDGKGAYVNVVASVNSDKRMEEPDCPEELITMRSTAKRQPADLLFGTFHIWTESDIN